MDALLLVKGHQKKTQFCRYVSNPYYIYLAFRLKVTTDEKPKKTGGRSPDLRGQKALDFISVFVRLRNKDFDKLSKEKQAKLMLPELEQIDIKMDLSSIFVKIKNFRQQFNQMKTKNKGHPVACGTYYLYSLKFYLSL